MFDDIEAVIVRLDVTINSGDKKILIRVIYTWFMQYIVGIRKGN